MPQTTTLYRGQVSTTSDGSNRVVQTLFTLPGSGFIAAKIIFSRLVMQFTPAEAGISITSQFSLIHVSSAGGQFPISNSSGPGNSATSVAIAPSEGNGGPSAFFNNTGNTFYYPGITLFAPSSDFSSSSVNTSVFSNTSSLNHIPKIFWMGPGDSIILNSYGTTSGRNLTIDYLFTAISET